MSAAIGTWLAREAGRAAERLGWGDGADGALRVAEAAGFAGFLARTGGERFVRDRGTALLQRLRERVLLEAAAELSAALTDARARHCFIKGVALLGRVYEPADRELLDLDLLVHPADVRTALRAVRGLGYSEPRDAADAARGMRRGMEFARHDPAAEGGAVRLDANWAVAPVDRLLSYADSEALDPVWGAVDTAGPVPAPAPGHHLALVIHHLVHHDLLHARGLLDAALLWPRLDADERRRLEQLTRRLRVRRLTAALGRRLGRPSAGPRGLRARRLDALLEPAALLAWAVGSDERAHLELTPARVRRRMLLVDRPTDILRLARDLVAPPAAYLRWRWPDAPSAASAWLAHLRRVAGKAAGSDLPA